jgi:two-component system OmpR family response regulator
VLTRSQIIEAVWDFAYDGGSNVVDQYVNYLRRKIDVPFGRHDIETVRGKACLAAGSSLRSPSARTTGRDRSSRRASARSRAASSSRLNGLTR